jgi:acyl CoA:acetate/3-ketoacid CoA transferase alpha subunit
MNATMALAATRTIVEVHSFVLIILIFFIFQVEELVPAGSLDPDEIHLPGIYVQDLYVGKNYEKHIEVLNRYFC